MRQDPHYLPVASPGPLQCVHWTDLDTLSSCQESGGPPGRALSPSISRSVRMQPRPWSLTTGPQPQPGPSLGKSPTSLCLSFLSKECSELTVCVQGSTVEHMT